MQNNVLAMRAVVSLILGALTLFVSPQAHAGVLEATKERGILVVGVREDFPPLGYLDANGKNTGFEVDLARYLARQLLGDESKLQLVPVLAANRITTLHSQSTDLLIAAVTATEDRTYVFAFSEPYFLSGTLLLVPRNSAIHDIGDVPGKRVAVLTGSIQEGSLQPVFPDAVRVRFWSVPEAIDALRAGRVDALAEDDVLVLALARQYPDLTAVGKPFHPHPYAIAMPKGDKELVAWVNDQLQRAKADGTYNALWNEYFGQDEALLLRP